MEDEEIKAIEKLKWYFKDSKSLDIAKQTYIVLNLIEKQKAETEKLKNTNKDLLRKLRNRVKDVKKLEKYSLYKKEFSTLNKQLKEKDLEIETLKRDFEIVDHEFFRLEQEDIRKDMMINEMAKTLKWALNVNLGFIPSSICTCEGNIENCKDKICTDCIKEYFENKVKESK